MQHTQNSPAVESLKKERREQKTKKSNLDEGLEQSFPGSDPVSVTTTSVASGRPDVEEAEKVQTEDKKTSH